MNPDHVFQHAILDDPDDDAARLVYADWLDDRGDPRGELIRVQVRLAAWEPDLDVRTQLQQREAELLATHAATWLGPLRSDCSHFEFRRGFARLTLPVAHFLRLRSAKRTLDLFRRVKVESIRLTGPPAQLLALADATPLKAITALDLSGNELDDWFVCALVESAHLTRLTRLDLSNNRISDGGVQALIDAPIWERLTWLDLRNNRVSSTGALNLKMVGDAYSRCLYDLRGNDLSDASLRTLMLRDGTSASGARPVNSLGMEFARIPPGTFLMGSPETEAKRKLDEGPQRPFKLTQPFYLGVYLVTQQEYEQVMGVNPSEFTSANGGGPTHPVENISWDEASAFCKRLSELPEEREAGRVYRLPTEVEWEHAGRAGTTTSFHYGPTLTSQQANMNGDQPYFAPRGPSQNRTSPVGSYQPNAFGLYDMHGNVWEWCQDWYSEQYLRDAAATDPVGPESGSHRVQRGGCWGAYGECCRSAYRASNDPPGRRLNCIGMRVVLKSLG